MRKGQSVTHWTPKDDATISKMRAAGATWASVAKAVSTRSSKRSPAATMQRWRYTEGKQKRKSPARKTHRRAASAAPPAAGIVKTVTIDGKKFVLPKLTLPQV